MIASAKDAGLSLRDQDVADESSDVILADPRAGSEESYLVARLTEIQERYHYLPHNALVLLSEILNLPLSQIYAVATFYNAFSLKPRGAHLIRVCMGTACHVRGAPQICQRLESKLGIHAGETTRDRRVTLETVNCLGACALGPIAVVDNEYTGQMDIAKADRLLKNLSRAHNGKEPA
ncbi:MAG: NAD(P)H-dependent oxidoreductase subunit E [Chloroflexi bacterium]|nr:NAD(P)H-dependent oxidoreductase subunit E [Chloroflexota bacterium]